MFRNPSGPISHDSGSRTCLIERRIGPAKSEMKEPRSSVMSAKTTCGDESWKPLDRLQLKPKSTRICVEIDGRMFPRSGLIVEKSRVGSGRSNAPPAVSILKMSLRDAEASFENVRRPLSGDVPSVMSIEPLKKRPEISFVCALTGAWWLPSHWT